MIDHLSPAVESLIEISKLGNHQRALSELGLSSAKLACSGKGRQFAIGVDY